MDSSSPHTYTSTKCRWTCAVRRTARLLCHGLRGAESIASSRSNTIPYHPSRDVYRRGKYQGPRVRPRPTRGTTPPRVPRVRRESAGLCGDVLAPAVLGKTGRCDPVLPRVRGLPGAVGDEEAWSRLKKRSLTTVAASRRFLEGESVGAGRGAARVAGRGRRARGGRGLKRPMQSPPAVPPLSPSGERREGGPRAEPDAGPRRRAQRVASGSRPCPPTLHPFPRGKQKRRVGGPNPFKRKTLSGREVGRPPTA